MIKALHKLKPQQAILLGMAGAVGLCALVFQSFVRPAYDEWQQTKASVAIQAAKLARLRRNLGIRRSVDEQYVRIPAQTFASASDEVVLAKFLRELEMVGRNPAMSLVNMKPQAVQMTGTHRSFPVKLTIAGKLQEVLRFVVAATNRPEVTGLRSFSVRGVQHGDLVECSLFMWMVKLTGRAPEAPPAPGSVAEAADG